MLLVDGEDGSIYALYEIIFIGQPGPARFDDL